MAQRSRDDHQFPRDARTLLLTYPLMCAIQQISAEIGRVTGRGLAGSLRRHYPTWLLYGVLALLIIANVINIGAGPCSSRRGFEIRGRKRGSRPDEGSAVADASPLKSRGHPGRLWMERALPCGAAARPDLPTVWAFRAAQP
jgi:hypothetical protein